jgi:hypothetical protein
MTGGRMYGQGIESGRILVAPPQFSLMNPSMQQDFILVRTPRGSKMYTRNTEAALKMAKSVHGIVTEDEWVGKQDPEYLQFIKDVRYVIEVLRENYYTPRYHAGKLIGWAVPDPTKDGEDFPSVSLKADADECPDYLCAVAYTAFAELKIAAHPAVEHQFDTYWTLYIVD